MRKGIIFLLAASTLFGLGFMGQTEKVEAAEETIVYETGFESSQGFTASTTYNNKKAMMHGLQKEWSVICGTPTTSDAISNSQSMQMRVYKSTGPVTPMLYSNRSFENASRVTFKAKGSVTANTLTVEKSFDGINWTGEQNYTLKTSAQSFEYTISEVGEDTYLKFTFVYPSNYTDKSRITIDDICIYSLPNEGGNDNEPDTPIVPEDKSPEVNALFTSYYNEGSYTKYSVLNTNKMADEEVKKYFHAGADTKYRKTVYTPEGLKMTTKDTENGEYTNDSIYKNEGGKVVHTGLGGDYTVNKPSVEDWFVTLKNFVDNTGAGWTYEKGVYSLELNKDTDSTLETEENDLTRMAREFVAPMWLAPNDVSKNYVLFTKLTVEEVNNTLVMKLYVHNENSGLLEDDANNVLSQITISKQSESLDALAAFHFGANGSATHSDGSEASSTLEFTEGENTLSLTETSKVYKNAIDAKGNSCLKLGTGKAVGSFKFTAPDNVNKVIINVAGYKGDTVKITVNGVSHTINTLSNNGEYTPITVDTSTTKTLNFATTSTGYRCMINSIEYHK